MIKWSLRRKRSILGTIMFWSFVALAFQFHFFSKVFFQYREWYIAMFMLLGVYWHMWVPSVVLIVMSYLLLTKVFKDDENEKESSKIISKKLVNKKNHK